MRTAAGSAKRLTARSSLFRIHTRDPFAQERREVPAVAVLQRRPQPIVSANDLSAERRAAIAGHFPVSDRRLQCVVDGDFFAGGNVSPRLEHEFVAHPQVRVAGVVTASDHLIVLEQDVDTLTDRRAVVLRARARDPAQLGVIDNTTPERADGFTFGYRRRREKPKPFYRRWPCNAPRAEPPPPPG